MKLIKPNFEELSINGINPLDLGERCIRVCYKSENLIKEGSAKKLIKRILDSGHTAMLEHIPVYLKAPMTELQFGKMVSDGERTFIMCLMGSKYQINRVFNGNIYFSTNLRVLYDINPAYAIEYLEHEGENFTFNDEKVESIKYEDCTLALEKRITILFTMDRIGSQSFCRHRVFSFAQESTRWCNYIKEKFGSEISIITPCWLKEEDSDEFTEDMKQIEELYFKWINKGYKAEEARTFLPFGLKTEIIMTGFVQDWKGFFALRNDYHAHPQAQELAKPLEEYFDKQGYLDDKYNVKKEINYEIKL